ncbi:MAG TPA: tetratricopeptide repeat-containing diguanylate cyclase [Thermoanaerobaculia bacterium]|nr:tetratricopeptide repeat-containing diguanylate cyclase [Thermoanaerobaculia bacterium]
MKMFLPLTVTMALLFAADAVAAEQRSTDETPRGVEAVLAEAKQLETRDPSAARSMLDQVLRSPDLTAVQRVRAISNRCWLTEEPAQARALAEQGLVAARAANAPAQIADLLSCHGNALENAGNADQALEDYRASRAVAEKIPDLDMVAQTYAESGYALYARGDLNDALVELQKAYDLSKRVGNDKTRRTALTYIAHTYADARIAQYDRAIEYYRQILADYEREGAQTSVADTLFNLASTYERKNDLGAALLWYGRALKAEETLKRRSEIAYVKRSIGVTLSKLGRTTEAMPLFDAAIRYFVTNGEENNEMMTRQSRGVALRKLGRLEAAIADLEATRRYFEAAKNSRFLEKTMEELALAYAASGRWQQAFDTRSAELVLQRQLAEKLREEHTSRLRVQFDAEKKEQENRALIRENALRARALDAAARIRRLQTLVLILGAAIIIVLAYLVVRDLRDSRRMRVMAMTDELTRLPNRRHFLAEAQGALDRARAHGEPFSFISFDIDHFKRINDTWGHAAGDLVLQRIAHACRTAMRPGDRIGRVGGEEFAVLLPSRLADAEAIAERLRAAVEGLDITDIDPALRVTISLGVTEWTAADATVETIAGRADEVLYRAKEGGRNRVELAVA